MRFIYQPPAEQPLHILHQDEALLIVCKPCGLLAVPGRGDDRQDSMSSRVQRHYPEALVVHRLDMATSGIMLFALDKDVQRAINALFARRKVEKIYTAIVDGLVSQDAGEINQPLITDWDNRPRQKIDPIYGKPSRTQYQVLSRDKNKHSTCLELKPITGRSHQLRVHLQWLNHPILGDSFYASLAAQQKAERLLLHATSITFQHPTTKCLLHIHHQADFHPEPNSASSTQSPTSGR